MTNFTFTPYRTLLEDYTNTRLPKNELTFTGYKIYRQFKTLLTMVKEA